jgi:hypothetical protein
MVREKPPNAKPPFGNSGLGGLRGDKESLQIFSLQGQHSLEFRAAGTLSASGKPNIVVGSPPEFKGEPDIWAPEELLVGSVNTCMMLTFLSLAQAKGLTPVEYESAAEGLLEIIEGKHHRSYGSTSRKPQKQRRIRTCPRNHGKCRSTVLHLEFHKIEGHDHCGVCHCSLAKMKTNCVGDTSPVVAQACGPMFVLGVRPEVTQTDFDFAF